MDEQKRDTSSTIQQGENSTDNSTQPTELLTDISSSSPIPAEVNTSLSTGAVAATPIDQATQGTYNDSPPSLQTSVPASSVVITPPRKSIPKWFLFLFFLTLAVFIVTSILLGRNMLQKGGGKTSFSPSPTENISPTQVVSSPTPFPTPTTDLIMKKITSISATNDLSSLEADVKSTDVAILEETLKQLDQEL